MGWAYLERYDADAVAQHAAVVFRRDGRLVHVESLGTVESGSLLCVVADDRPGLLALVGAALLMNQLDVVEGEAHTREMPGRPDEAVDLFVVRQRDPAAYRKPVGPQQAQAVEATLRDLIAGERTPESGETEAVPEESETTVRFLEDKHGVLTTLEVEASDRPGLLRALATALYKQDVQIVSSLVRTRGKRVLDQFHIRELTGEPISNDRRLQIQLAVMSTV